MNNNRTKIGWWSVWCGLQIIAIFSLIACNQASDMAADGEEQEEVIDITVPSGFTLDELYRPSDYHMGTWVALAEGPNNRFYASDQFGDLYQFDRPEIGEVLDSTKVDSVDLEIGYAHGLMWAFNSLYVAVNRQWADTIECGSGVYRLTDQDGDGNLDHQEMLLELDGAGEHGPHSFIMGPDGKDIYFIAGNHTLIPEKLKQHSRLPNHWDEDNLLPPYPDARGHAVDIMAPGGWIARTDSTGAEWEVVAAGFRNAFDFAFNDDGELFAFDADMEWDFGMPWYRPIRICHATSGAEFGWRRGTGKWPTYYPDALPSVVDLGQGSPTALLFGDKLNFPGKYKHGLFANDWSFGTMYFIDLKAEGSTYHGSKEQFLFGVPFPLTDAIAGSDGHMYFATGGRKLASRLYRLRYTGDVTTMEVEDDPHEIQLRQLRRQIEQLHDGPQPGGVTQSWTYLDHEDRFIRYAARVALEHQPVARWQDRFFIEKSAQKLIPVAIALARCAESSSTLQAKMIDKLGEIDWSTLSKENQLDLLRAYELILVRMGQPLEAARGKILDQFSTKFPTSDLALDRELTDILIFLRDETATASCIELMQKHTTANTVMDVEMLSDEISSRHERYGEDVKKVISNMPPAEAIFYAVALSHATVGWTKELHEIYFQWFYDAYSTKGGLSFKAFMENIRQNTLKQIPEEDRAYFEELSGVYSPAEDMANLPQPEGPGEAYNMSDINKILRQLKEYEGEIATGKRIYEAALCSTCHRMQGEGGISGPDLTQINTRFKRGDIVNAVFSPSDEISDQYGFTLFNMKDGSKKSGKIFSETDEMVTIMPNPYTSVMKVDIPIEEIDSRGLSPVSPMPPGLLNRLNDQEIIDLFAYLLSGADEEHYYYGGEKGRDEETD